MPLLSGKKYETFFSPENKANQKSPPFNDFFATDIF
jgi:hypothetical protein